MAAKKTYEDPSLVNSSYVVFFHALVFIIGPFITLSFPVGLRDDAALMAIVFPIVLFWFSFLMKQFFSVTTAMRLILGAAFLVAALTFVNAVHGPITAGEVPVIYTQVPFFATLLAGLSGQPGFIYAGTVLAYGAYTYISCVAIASLLERKFNRLLPSLPKTLKGGLRSLDSRIDRKAAKASDAAFVNNQLIGIGLCLALLAVYAGLYIALLMFN